MPRADAAAAEAVEAAALVAYLEVATAGGLPCGDVARRLAALPSAFPSSSDGMAFAEAKRAVAAADSPRQFPAVVVPVSSLGRGPSTSGKDGGAAQSRKDCERDRWALGGAEAVSGAAATYAGVCRTVAAAAAAAAAQWDEAADTDAGPLAEAAVLCGNRTESGGASFEALQALLASATVEHVVVPSSAAAPAIALDASLGARESLERGWEFGVTVTVSAVTVYDIWNPDMTATLAGAEVEYANTVLLPLDPAGGEAGAVHWSPADAVVSVAFR